MRNDQEPWPKDGLTILNAMRRVAAELFVEYDAALVAVKAGWQEGYCGRGLPDKRLWDKYREINNWNARLTQRLDYATSAIRDEFRRRLEARELWLTGIRLRSESVRTCIPSDVAVSLTFNITTQIGGRFPWVAHKESELIAYCLIRVFNSESAALASL